MSPDLTLALIAIVAAVISFVCADYIRRSNKRRKKQQEKAQKETAEQAHTALREASALAALAAGFVRVEVCEISDIKYGDTVCWKSDDGQKHTDYVAGYDGDPGPSTEGLHGKPVLPKGLQS